MWFFNMLFKCLINIIIPLYIYYQKYEVASFKLNIAKYIPQKANYVVVTQQLPTFTMTEDTSEDNRPIISSKCYTLCHFRDHVLRKAALLRKPTRSYDSYTETLINRSSFYENRVTQFYSHTHTYTYDLHLPFLV